MDHESSIRDQFAERYLLGGLPAVERDAFEEHFFTCPVCAEEVRTGLEFRANARAVFREGRLGKGRAAERSSGGWLWWLRSHPVLASSAVLNVALLIVTASQVQRLGGMKSALEESQRPGFYAAIFVPAAYRSEPRVNEVPRGTRLLGLSLDLRPEELDYPDYTYRLEDASGRQVRSGALGTPHGRRGEVSLALPLGGLGTGSYTFVLAGSRTGTSTELRRALFHISE